MAHFPQCAFSKSDWIYLLKLAGIQHYQLRWVWLFRWEIITCLKRNISVIFVIWLTENRYTFKK